MSKLDSQAGFHRDIYSVSRLNSEVRSVLEGSFPLLWVEGEISNLARPASGHIYFSLKDAQAQVRCAMFRMKRQHLRFQPENGLKVLIRARVGLYEGRGEFQLIAEHMEPAGEGDLRQAFDQLKQKLQTEGLFDTAQKRALPILPKRIGIITSPTGAAVQDVLTVLQRRFPAIPLLIFPVVVQGDEAAQSIINALKLAEKRQDCDLLILTRGGGSLEDLMAFNDEGVARTIHQLTIPLISAVGHEIDFTIADFVADQRAPTPSVAAELATPDSQELLDKLNMLQRRVTLGVTRKVKRLTELQQNLNQRLRRSHPGVRLQQQQQYLDELSVKLEHRTRGVISNKNSTLAIFATQLYAKTPIHKLSRNKELCTTLHNRLQRNIQTRLKGKQHDLGLAVGKLNTLSPLATLDRGYSITRLLPQKNVILDAAEITVGDNLETRIANGTLYSTVTSTSAKNQG
ncbi:MAG: exodeoxyribonuclease VII large subunit [Sedimenticola sp.]|nr:exodeoxyribonuclease VII large subunit [Sedimenticola sp.]MCW8948422.1 exodeoxyribonuclease VII large subunit [Sedimenticola sp.]